MKIKFKKYLPSLFVLIVVFITIVLTKNVFPISKLDVFFLNLCDIFFVSAVVLCGVGLISYMSSKGAYDIFGYGVKSLVYLFSPNKRALAERKDFYEYKQEKNSKRNSWLKEFLIFGLICLAISIVFLILYFIV